MRICQRAHFTLVSPTFGALFFLVLAVTLQQSAGNSDQVEVRALEAIKRSIGDGFNKLSTWTGNDPCGTNWTGVICTPIDGVNHVTELRLLNMNFTGTLAPDLGNLTHLNILNFMWNNITGSIPSELQYLGSLQLLLLNGNKLSGTLPPELGNLSNLTRFQIDANDISGPIPPSYQSLSKIKHFHMNNNSLNGTIPRELGSLQSIIHILFDNNNLSGELPSELANISTLTILQLDNNQFSGPIPTSFSQMFNITKLSLRNCNLTGPVLNVSALTSLVYLDLSENQLTGGLPTNLSQTLKTIDLSYNQLDGELPAEYYALQSLEQLLLENNSLSGNVPANLFSHNAFPGPQSVLILDYQNNNFTGFTSGALLDLQNVTLRLAGNRVCDDDSISPKYCDRFNGSITDVEFPSTAMVSTASCPPSACDGTHNQELNYGLLALGTCSCAYPLTVHYRLKSPSFAVYPPYEMGFESYLALNTELDESQINASVFRWEPGPRLSLIIKLFPGNGSQQFSGSDVSRLYTQFATWHFPDNKTFGPYEMLGFDILFPYNGSSSGVGSKTGLSAGAIAGIVIAAALLTALVVGVFMLFVVRRKYKNVKARRQTARQYERLKIDGVRDFTYEEMAKATDNFDSSRQIGQGGYGRVYKAVLPDGTEVAIKRAQEGSLQGQREFLTELELLSRVHHRNILSLVGFCDDEGEQMLVYEYMPNGTLRDNLNSGSRAPLSFATRLQLAIGAAKGILYLHTEADPPIFHRDIKASNILLDKKQRARVADFGLSKLAVAPTLEGDAGGHVSTVVKGTPGYLDPEYFLTHKLTDRSDVYSFGVVLLELITGQQPISMGKNLVREVNLAYEAGMVLSIVDPRMGHYPSECLQPLLRLAISCCRDDTDARPSMAEVVRELEGIWRLMPSHDSMSSFETSVDSSAGNGKHEGTGYVSSSNPFVSHDTNGSNLASGYAPSIAPR